MQIVFALFALLIVACSSKTTSTVTHGHDAGAGCDDTVHAHCLYPSGVDSIDDACVEFSGAARDDTDCVFPRNVVTSVRGQYASGPCPRDAYDQSCTQLDTAPLTSDSGACTVSYLTVWGHSSTWNGTIPGLPPCLH